MAGEHSTQQVIVGTLGQNGDGGQLSLFTLPERFEWLRYLSASELVDFFTELLSALARAAASGEFAGVTELLESWEATAELSSDAELAAAVEEGQRALESGEVVPIVLAIGQRGGVY